MKNIYFFFIILSCSLTQVLAQSVVYGNANNNHPSVIKAFNDGLYVASTETIGTSEFAIFTKFDINNPNVKIWEKRFSVATRINDFDYNSATNELVLVGHRGAIYTGVNTQSFWAIISGTGSTMTYKEFDQPGNDYFNRIIRHTNGKFYILGAKNATITPSNNDVVVLCELNPSTYLLNWVSELIYTTSPTDDEFMRGLFQFGNNLMIVGNGFANDGILIEADVTTLIFQPTIVRSVKYTNVLDIYDGIDLGNNFFGSVTILAATNF